MVIGKNGGNQCDPAQSEAEQATWHRDGNYGRRACLKIRWRAIPRQRSTFLVSLWVPHHGITGTEQGGRLEQEYGLN